MDELTFKAISFLKILSLILYSILWIYNEISAKIIPRLADEILGVAFALSILLFCCEVPSLYRGYQECSNVNSGTTLLAYLILAVAYSSVISIGNLNTGE
ncbi:1103_t:CDS:1, partial [Racocetra persica]